jgi:putative mRNA 3-end processing factor
LSIKATITNKGAVLLGKYVACDAFDESMPLRIVTHAHADHMMGLQQSLKTCEKVMMTKATRDLIDVLRSPLFLMGGFIEAFDYGKTVQYEEEHVTFFQADHILGAAQVFVEDVEGNRIVFTGDFRIDETPVLEADVLVMEATYGSPTCRRAFTSEVRDLLISMVETGLEHGAVCVFGYHGKLQEVMQILHKAKIEAPFVVPERVFHVSMVCEKHGMRLGHLMLSEEREAKELLEKNSPCVAFYHMNARSKISRDFFRISVSGWEFDVPCREISNKEYIIALSDHSDFDGLMEYVRRSKPKLVITDNYRVGHAETLAKEIQKRFRVSAVALPKK